jgi:hypothetical protein
MSNRTIYITLAASAGFVFFFTLTLYALHGGNPLNRLGYGIFVSVLPAVGALVVLKFTRLLVSWRGAALIYVLLFLLVVSQVFVRRYL